MSELEATLARHLAEGLRQVLEESAFVLATVTGSPRTPTDPLCLRIPFTRPKRGVLYLAAPGEWASELVQELVEEEIGPHEVIGEFLNMASGIMFERWLGSEELYEMGTPEECDYSELEGCGCMVGLETEEGVPLVLGVKVEE